MRKRNRTGKRARLRRRLAGRRSLIATGCMGLMACTAPAFGQDVSYEPRTTFGEVGILDMPSARNAPDGQLAFTAGVLNGTQHYNLSFQLVPWAEASFRYSRIPNLLGPGIAEFDRSFGLKIRLAQESEYFPQIAIGARDILGTGIYSGEYLVASKRVSDFDFTLGMGWGRFSQEAAFGNPFAAIFPSFKNRTQDIGLGGNIAFGQLFHGPNVGLYGGFIWQTPVEDLDVLVEYSSDRYDRERQTKTFVVRSPVNMGLSYKFFDIATVSAGWFYGTGYGATVTLSADPTIPVSPQHIGPEIPAPIIRPDTQQVGALAQLYDRTRLGKASIKGPWVQVPTADANPEAMALMAALSSVSDGVRDIEVAGRVLMIDAQLGKATDRQCARYAQIVSPINRKIDSIALSDYGDPSGRVALCRIAHVAGDDAGDEGPPPLPSAESTAPFDPPAAMRKIRQDVEAQALHVEALAVEPQMVWLYYSNARYLSEAEAAGRLARVLMADAPASVEIFHIVSVRNGVDLHDFQIARSALERATSAFGTTRELGSAVAYEPSPLSNPIFDRASDDTYPRFHWNIGPGLREGFFNPATPLQIQILAAAEASVDVTPKLTLETRLEANIYNNYDLNQPSDSVLPHVRSDANLYFKHGINGISSLDAVYRTRLSRDVFLEAKAGYLEDMFAGGGVQALWRPEGSRLSFGADLYEVWQRNFDRLFGVQNYHVLTGHVSAYYDSPWYGLNFAVHGGRYLAGDYGATFEVTRRFDSGVEVGAFATFTNVPFAKFGEGSFDKGIILHVPLEWALPFYSQGDYDLHLRSLIRDGGQRLDNDDSLYGETLAGSYGEVQRHLDEIVAP